MFVYIYDLGYRPYPLRSFWEILLKRENCGISS